MLTESEKNKLTKAIDRVLKEYESFRGEGHPAFDRAVEAERKCRRDIGPITLGELDVIERAIKLKRGWKPSKLPNRSGLFPPGSDERFVQYTELCALVEEETGTGFQATLRVQGLIEQYNGSIKEAILSLSAP